MHKTVVFLIMPRKPEGSSLLAVYASASLPLHIGLAFGRVGGRSESETTIKIDHIYLCYNLVI
jgi:hypothetical protein